MRFEEVPNVAASVPVELGCMPLPHADVPCIIEVLQTLPDEVLWSYRLQQRWIKSPTTDGQRSLQLLTPPCRLGVRQLSPGRQRIVTNLYPETTSLEPLTSILKLFGSSPSRQSPKFHIKSASFWGLGGF